MASEPLVHRIAPFRGTSVLYTETGALQALACRRRLSVGGGTVTARFTPCLVIGERDILVPVCGDVQADDAGGTPDCPPRGGWSMS